MRVGEYTGRTIEEAQAKGLAQLGVTPDRVTMEVLEAPARGLRSLLGARMAKVRLSVADDPQDLALEFLRLVTTKMGLELNLSARSADDTVFISASGEKVALFIGRRGETIDALQYLCSLALARKTGQRVRVLLDAEGYRQRREETLKRMAKQTSERVRRTGRRISLEPMNAQERRVVHLFLEGEKGITTFSEGQEPYRKVIVVPNNSGGERTKR